MAHRLTSGQWVVLAAGGLAAIAIAGILFCAVTLRQQRDARTLLVDRLDPATVAALDLNTALVNEETGVRGFVIESQPAFLAPYTMGRVVEGRRLAELDRLSRQAGVSNLAADVGGVRATTSAWRAGYAERAIAAARAGFAAPSVGTGRPLFDAVRRSMGSLRTGLATERAAARQRLRAAASRSRWAVVVVGVVIVLSVIAVALALRSVVGLPVGRLAAQVRRVAQGEFGRPIDPGGARDVAQLGTDVERMRERIVDELQTVEEARERLTAQATELERSNAELEQFAYVASHDLQEPLRKVASFCQALERRYGDELDDRAKQYIAFAVDGAKRMQVLINDLLAFSRVGRSGEAAQLVDIDDLVERARHNLDTAIEETGARIVVEGDLPVVHGDATLLTLVFQNLIGNAIKFHGDGAPEVRLSARRQDGEYLLTCADNGIGIARDYAERIFIIFQRLHPKETYAGTGIGLAMCRKIVEHHGGRIWLDPTPPGTAGATFHLTFPVPEQEQLP